MSATKKIALSTDQDEALYELFDKVREGGFVSGICAACCKSGNHGSHFCVGFPYGLREKNCMIRDIVKENGYKDPGEYQQDFDTRALGKELFDKSTMCYYSVVDEE